MKHYQYLLLLLFLTLSYAFAQRQSDNLRGFKQVCLFMSVLTESKIDLDRMEVMSVQLTELTTTAGIQVLDADSCQALTFDANSDTLKLLLTLQTHAVPEGGHAYTYSLLGLLSTLDSFSSVSVYRRADFGISSESERDAVLGELMSQAISSFAEDWQLALSADQAVSETSSRIDGPTPNGGAYAIAHYEDEHGMPTTKEQARSVEIIEYNERGEPIHSTRGYINP